MVRLVIILVFSSLFAFGQIATSIHLGMGISKSPSTLELTDNTSSHEYNYSNSQNVGFDFWGFLHKKIFLEAGISFERINTTDIITLRHNDPSFNLIRTINYSRNTFDYLSLHPKIGMELSSFRVSLGVKYSFLLDTKDKTERQFIGQDEELVEFTTKEDNVTELINKKNLSIVAGIDYAANDRVRAGIEYSHGLSNLINPQAPWKRSLN